MSSKYLALCFGILSKATQANMPAIARGLLSLLEVKDDAEKATNGNDAKAPYQVEALFFRPGDASTKI